MVGYVLDHLEVLIAIHPSHEDTSLGSTTRRSRQ